MKVIYLKSSWSKRRQEKEEKENKVLRASKMATQEDSELDSSWGHTEPATYWTVSCKKDLHTHWAASAQKQRPTWGQQDGLVLSCHKPHHWPSHPPAGRTSNPELLHEEWRVHAPHTKLQLLTPASQETSLPSICLENQWGLLPQTHRAANWETAVERFATQTHSPQSPAQKQQFAKHGGCVWTSHLLIFKDWHVHTSVQNMGNW